MSNFRRQRDHKLYDRLYITIKLLILGILYTIQTSQENAVGLCQLEPQKKNMYFSFGTL